MESGSDKETRCRSIRKIVFHQGGCSFWKRDWEMTSCVSVRERAGGSCNYGKTNGHILVVSASGHPCDRGTMEVERRDAE